MVGMKEIWLEIKEWEGYYISNKGRVKNKDGIRKLWVNKYRNNYVSVFHTRGEKISPPMFKIHRLVAKYFIPNPENKPQVNHIDNDPQNNHVSNLEWVTPKENIAHMIKQNRQIWLKGEQCKQSILTEKTVKSIFSLKGKHPYKEIAKMFNTNYSNVAHIMRGSRWQHITNPNLELLTPDL